MSLLQMYFVVQDKHPNSRVNDEAYKGQRRGMDLGAVGEDQSKLTDLL